MYLHNNTPSLLCMTASCGMLVSYSVTYSIEASAICSMKLHILMELRQQKFSGMCTKSENVYYACVPGFHEI